MTVQLSSLRVVGDLDASKYVAGMNQKVAADKAGTASSKQVAQTLVQQDRALGQSSGVLARLSNQYVEGYRQASSFEKAVAALGRGMETGNVPMARAEAILEGLHRKYGLTANAAQLMEAGQVSLAQAVSAVNARLEMQEAVADGTSQAMMRYGAASNMASWQANNLRLQMFDVVQMLALGQNPILTLMQQGPQIAQIYGPEEGGVARAFREAGTMVGRFAVRLAPVGAILATLGIGAAALRSEMNELSDVTVSFGDIALSVWQMARDGFMNTFGGAVDTVQGWFAVMWDNIGQFAVSEFNSIARNMAQLSSQIQVAVDVIAAVFASGFEAAKLAWSGLPAALGDYVYATANRVVQGIEAMVNSAADVINGLTSKLPDWVPEWMRKQIGPVDFGGVENPYAGSASSFDAGMQDIATRRNAAISAAMSAHQDRMAGIAEWNPFGDLSEGAIANARDRLKEVEDAADGAGSALSKAANDNSRYWERLARQAKRAAEETREFWRDVTGGFISDLRSGLEQGKGFWRSFGDAALNALDKITDKLLNEVLDALFRVNQAGVGGGGVLGFLGGLLGGGGFTSFETAYTAAMPGLWAKGGAFQGGNVIPFARGGIVDRPTLFPMANGAGLMGEAGPEAIMPLRRGPDGRLGVSAPANSNAVNQNGPMSVNINVNVSGARGNAEIREMVATGVQDGIEEFSRKGLPFRVREINDDPRAVG